MRKNKEEISFAELFSMFVPWIWVIVVVAVSLAILTGGYFMVFTNDTYTSSVKIYFYRGEQQASMNDKDAEAMVEIAEIVIESDELLNKVVAAYPEKNLSASYLRSAITFSRASFF